MIAALVIIAVVAIATGVITATTRTKGQHAAPHGDTFTDLLPAVPAGPWPAAPKPEHASPTMVPLYGADDAPSPRSGRHLVAVPGPNAPGPVLAPGPDAGQLTSGHDPGPGALRAVADEIDELVADVRERFGLASPPAPGPRDKSLLERYERLVPDRRPGYWVEATNGHSDNSALVNSICHRALTADVIAELDAAKEAAGNG